MAGRHPGHTRTHTHTLAGMSDSPFLRPGSDPEPMLEAWPYVPPQVEPVLLETRSSAASGSSPAASRTPVPVASGRRRGPVLVAGLMGLLIGALGAGWLSGLLVDESEPIPITLGAFPESIANLARPDLALAGAEDSVDVEQFQADFEAQREEYRFAYGGDGAAVDYGQFLLTIVNGSQPLPLPSDAARPPDSASPILISLDSGTVSCVCQPELGLYDSAVLQMPADLSAKGWTQCVLNDGERRVSLKLDSRVPGIAVETSRQFARILERIQESFDA